MGSTTRRTERRREQRASWDLNDGVNGEVVAEFGAYTSLDRSLSQTTGAQMVRVWRSARRRSQLRVRLFSGRPRASEKPKAAATGCMTG